MSGGGSDKPKTGTKKDEPSGTIPGTSPLMTQPAFIGDNQNMLAQQLAAGGYGAVPDLMSMLSQTFTPMQVLDTRPGAVATPSTPTTPTTTTPQVTRDKLRNPTPKMRSMNMGGRR